MYVLIDEPQGAYYGGIVAAPVASEIFKSIFEMNQYMQTEKHSVNTFILDTYIGLTLTLASSKASSSGLQYLTQGDGDFVTGQIPAPGVEVKEGDVVLLLFE